MKQWKIMLSIILTILLTTFFMNIATRKSIFNYTDAPINSSIFYEGIMIIVICILILCVVIVFCTSFIVKNLNNKK